MINNKWMELKDIPASSDESDAMSKDLKKEVLNLQAPPFAMLLCRLPAW